MGHSLVPIRITARVIRRFQNNILLTSRKNAWLLWSRFCASLYVFRVFKSGDKTFGDGNRESVRSWHALLLHTSITYPAQRMYLPFGASFKRSRIFSDTLAFFFPYRSISDGNMPTSEAIIAMSFGSCAFAMSMSLEDKATLMNLHKWSQILNSWWVERWSLKRLHW